MALPTHPSVVLIENDNSIYTPNVNSSVVGVVGFADKGPVNEATLITSQENLLRIFGKPNSDIPGQGLEGALEILEATNQVWFVRAASGSAATASATVDMGGCPVFQLSSSLASSSLTSAVELSYSAVDNTGTLQSQGSVTLASGAWGTSFSSALANAFSTGILSDQPLLFGSEGGSAYLASRYAGPNATLTLEFSAVADQFLPLDASGDPLAASLVASGYNSAANVVYESINPGTGYNLSSLRDGSIVGLSVEVDSLSIQDKVTINSEGSQVEAFNVDCIPSSINSVDYILNSDEAANKSDYVFAEYSVTGLPSNFFGRVDASSPRCVKQIEGTYSFSGGNSGYSDGGADDRTSLIGTATTKSGIYALDDNGLNISLAIVPGITHQSVQNALVTLAETSQQFLAVVSPPEGYTSAQEAVEWMNGRDYASRTSALNSSYAAVYFPWVQTFNYFAGADEWYDPAIFAVRQMVYTDNVSEPWFAPAGVRRGRLTKPTNVQAILNDGDKGALYANNINPISKEDIDGITIMGQKTAQRAPTALDRVNVRRLMIFMRKVLLVLGRPFMFQPNDFVTWEQVEESLNPFIDDLLRRRAIVEGDVKCDSSTNTPARVDRNEMWTDITIKPTKSAEFVVFQINLTNQSATING